MSGAAFAAILIFTATSGAQAKRAAPSDTVNIALIGCGAQGPGVARSFMGLLDVKVIAGCDVYGLKRYQFIKTVADNYSA